MEGSLIIEKFTVDPSDENMKLLVDHFKSEQITNKEIATLAKVLAESGEVLKSTNNYIKADIPSTGGPSSLSTLLTPLILKELGFYIPKLGVAGRPAGGIDVLYQIPGYKVHFNSEEISECLEKNKYCHFLVGSKHAPLDNILFNYRSKNNAKSIPPLVIASILSKKIAVGLETTGLDVRVGNGGNFGVNYNEAKQNSLKFIAVAKELGITAKCFLTNLNVMQQPFIGRGEALVALYNIFSNDMNPLLKDHLYKCIDMAIELSPSKRSVSDISLNSLYHNFKANVIAQGGSLQGFDEKVAEIKSLHTNEIKSLKNGFLNIKLDLLRDLITQYQAEGANKENLFPDSCGVIFKMASNDYVNTDDTILTYRVSPKIKDEFHNKLLLTFELCDRYQQDLNYQIIN